MDEDERMRGGRGSTESLENRRNRYNQNAQMRSDCLTLQSTQLNIEKLGIFGEIKEIATMLIRGFVVWFLPDPTQPQSHRPLF